MEGGGDRWSRQTVLTPNHHPGSPLCSVLAGGAGWEGAGDEIEEEEGGRRGRRGRGKEWGGRSCFLMLPGEGGEGGRMGGKSGGRGKGANWPRGGKSPG